MSFRSLLSSPLVLPLTFPPRILIFRTVPLAEAVKKAHPNLLVSAVGLLTTGDQLEDVLRSGRADVIFVARELLRDSSFVFRSAEELGVIVKSPAQYER